MTPERQNCQNRRIGLDEIPGDFATHKDFMAWSGLSKNAAYEALRQDPLRKHVVRFGRQIRIPKKVLARLMDGE